MKHINLIQMLQGCSKRNGMTVSTSMHDDGQNCNVKQRAELMSEDEKWSENGALSSTCLRSASVPLSFRSRYLRYAAMIFCVLVMSIANIGMAWGASPWLLETPTQNVHTQDGITISGEYGTSLKMKNSNGKAYTVNNTSLHIFSESTNITAISFEICVNSDGSGTAKAITVETSTGGAFSTPSGAAITSATKNGTNLASLSDIQTKKANQSTVDEIAITFATPVKAIELKKSGGANIRKIQLTYNSPSSYTTYYAAAIVGSSNDDGSVTFGPDGSSVTFDHSTSSQATINTKKYDKMEGNQVINLGTGNTFQVGDQIILDICSSGNNYSAGGIFDLTGSSDPTISVVTSKTVAAQVAYVVVANDGIAGQTSATIGKVGTTSYIHGITVLRAASSETYDIHIGKNNDNYTDESLTNTSGTTWSKTITLDASSYYEFKVKKTPSAGDAVWYGNNGKITATTSPAWDFNTSDGNCKLYTTVAGSYTFSWDASTNKLTVTYPAGEHTTKRVYMVCGDTWCKDSPKFFVHSWGVSEYNTQVQQNACGEYYADIIWYNDYFQFTRNASNATAYDNNQWNVSQDLTYNSSQTKWTCTGWSDGKGTFSSSAYSPDTYTVSAAASTAGYGTVSVSTVSSVPCGTSISASTNTLTVGATSVTATATTSTAQYTYAFTNWTWTPAGSTVTSDVTATANFTRTLNSYTVTWKNGETTLETDASVNYGATPSYDGSTPTKASTAEYDYTFDAWSPAVASVTGNATYTATFTQTARNYTLSWVTDGDELTGEYTRGTVAYGTTIVQPNTPTKSGYTFAGWDVTPAATMPAANTTYTATWTPVAVTYTVTYNAQGGSVTPSSETVSTATLPTPTKSGYTFDGWYTSGGSKITGTYNPTADITLYALWRESCAGGGGNKTLVDINFKDASWSGKTFSQANDNNEDLINGVYFWSKDASKHFSLADNTSKGLTFPNNNMSSGTYYFCIPITGINSSDKQITVTLKHGYSSAKATYKYVYIDGRTTFEDGNTGGSGGTQVEDAANADTEITFTKSSLSKTSGHLIIGRKSSSYTQIYGVTVTTPNNATCYYVTYNGNGATGGFMTDETAHGSGDNVAILANTYTREGYTFTGWKTEPSSGTDYAPEGTITGISSNITLYAQWSAGTLYSVTYNGNGATSGSVPVDASSPYASGSNVTVLGNTGTLALANYTFDGWATANDGTGTSYTVGGTISGIAADVELFAKWKQTVTLNTGSQGSEEEKTPYIYINGAALNGFSAHSAAGYTLNGYYTAPTGGTKVLNADGSFAAAAVTNYITGGKWSRTDATTLYAQWRAAAGSTCYEWDATVTKPQTGTNVNFGGLYLTAPNKTKVSFYSGQAADSCYDISAKAKTLYGNLNGLEISSVKFAVSTNSSDYRTIFIAFCSSTTFSTSNIIEVGGYQGTVYTVNKNDAAKSEFTVSAPAGTKSFAIGRNMDGITYSESFTAGQNRYLYYLQVCSAGGGTHTISYNAGGGTGTMSSNTGITDDGSQTLTTNSFTAPTNYSFAGWVADGAVTIGGDVKTAGTLIADGATITNITVDIALTAKWTQSITLNSNTSNHGTGDNTSATVMYNATALSSISHTSAESGYKLTGYFTADTDGTKVLNSDGTFAGNNIDGWISDGKWTCVASTRTLYAQYESAGALIWNLGVNTDATSLTTSSKTSAFTQIAVANMGDATLSGSTYTKSAKSSLTGKISSPATKSDYVYVTFKVADGYKFTPSNISVKVQPVGNGEHKNVELLLTDESFHSLASASATKCDGTTSGKTTTVSLAGNSTFFTGNVTLKIYVYDFSGSATGTYRLGTPITIEGEIEEACGTMPSYTSMSYTTTTFAPGDDASGSPITIVGGDNINTYQWKYNKVNDRTSGTNCGTGTSLTPLTNEGAATDGTRYYWCEMTNDACGITIKSPAVAITVAAAKSDATVTWTNPASTPNYGGGGYTIKATVEQTGWDGNAADLVITAPAGINIYNVTPGTDGSSRKYVEVHFDVQTSFDRTTYASNIPFTVSAAATASYNAISDEKDVDYSACTGGSASEELMPVNADSVNSTVKGWRFTGTGKMWYGHGSSTPGTGSSNIKSLSNTMAEGNIDHYYNSGGSYFSFYTEKAITGVRLYVYTSNSNVKVSNVYIANSQFATGTPSSGAVTYEVVYNDDNEGLDKGDNVYSAWAEITFDSEVAAGKYGLIKLDNNVKIAGIGLISTSGGGATLNTYLQWSGGLANGATVAKNTTDAYFTYSASKITSNTNTLGAITYSSSNTSAATVDATGKVALVAAGETTIKATLAASGCYKKAEISYTLNVTEVPCAITAGTLTLTSGTESKCSSANVTLTLTGFESGASIQWKDGDTNINNGGNYTIATDGTTSTLTTDQEGTYSVMVTSGCSVRSNRITISNKSTEVGAKRIVKNWYIKNGRLTPDIELWTLQNGAHLSSVTWSPDNATGLTASDFYESDGKVYLKGKEPSSNTSGADINYTLMLTVEDDCGSTTDMSASGQLIYLHHQQNTDKHVLAFVVNGTDKGGFTEGITAAQTTSVPLYNEIAANFDVLATNIYSTDDEQALKEYYSQFDILCVTDYPNTGTKGVNKKSYVDALGALVDIRPILTMEAFVAKLANWKAKGISGTPQSPTTRQYTMLLQCKDHEIFSGTKLTKVGEGDETMYRVSMVDNTQEEYVSLDATYGEGAHADKSGYEYASKPALQGFTFTKEMLDNDLLPLGLINDGSGNDLQVGIERQTEMEARLMVLGINSYAMERLTDDGQTVVVNALKYLMKKNAEDIADCSNTFVGGDDEEDVSTRYDWNVDSHWSGNAVPERTQKVRIVAPCVIKADEKVHVTGVVIAPRGKYNHGANTANGSLTIAAGGALIVDGKVEAATAPLYTETRATSAEDLTIQASETAQGALIFDNEDGETQATVEMYSPSYWKVQDGTNKKKSYWSYVGVPIQDVPVGEYFYGAVTYLYDETSGWIRKRIGSEFHAFEGIGLSLPEGHKETFYGTLASTETKEITLTKTTDVGEGDNLIGNSWTAPIQIGNFDSDDFGSATAVVSMYKTGRDDIEGNPTVVTATAENDGAVEAGQWVSIPIGLPGTDGYDGPTVIPSMQAFQVTTSSETTLTLDYDKLVRDVTIATDNLTQPMSAPKRKMKRAAKKSLDAMMRVRMSGFKTRADLWIMEDGRFSDEYDNGWEANYIECDNRSPQLYANSEIGKMAFLAKPDIEGTILGIAPSLDGNEYLFTFHYVGDEEFYLNDLKLKQSVLISEEESYSFMYEDGDTNRFYISRTRIDAPQMPTGVENTHGDAVKARKFIYNDKLYIMLNGRVYSAEGQIVK